MASVYIAGLLCGALMSLILVSNAHSMLANYLPPQSLALMHNVAKEDLQQHLYHHLA